MTKGKLNKEQILERLMFMDFSKVPINLPDTTPDWVVALGFQLKEMFKVGYIDKIYFDEFGVVQLNFPSMLAV
tara:strand:+ start:227 stop:445 length:219 start_codon:yes stop_codon:yes gene_type:complete